jgi:D-alanyl-D-alanine carboxypeptidase (penicillin-binding protein 5/6)
MGRHCGDLALYSGICCGAEYIITNETGLDKEGQKSTLKDVSILFKYAIKNKEFLNIIKNNSYTTSDQTITFKNGIKSRAKKVGMNYLLGGKTGTTGNAGLCLATIAEKDKVNYLLVTVGAPYPSNGPTNYTDQKKIYEYFMNNYSYKSIVDKDEKLLRINTKYSKKDYIVINAPKTIKKYLNNDFDHSKVKYKYIGKKEILYNTNKGTKLGKIDIIYNDKVLDTIDVYLDKKLELDVFKYICGHKLIIVVFGILFLLLMIIIIRKRTVKKKR